MAIIVNTIAYTTIKIPMLATALPSTLRPILAKNIGLKSIYATTSNFDAMNWSFCVIEIITPAKKAPVISATPKKYSAANDIRRQITNAMIACLCIPFPSCSHHFLYNL